MTDTDPATPGTPAPAADADAPAAATGPADAAPAADPATTPAADPATGTTTGLVGAVIVDTPWRTSCPPRAGTRRRTRRGPSSPSRASSVTMTAGGPSRR